MSTQSPYYTIEASFSFAKVEESDNIGDFLDAVAQHLSGLGGEDVSIVTDADAEIFIVSLIVPSLTADSIESVIGRGMGLLRTAFHACEGQTPAWPTPNQALTAVHVTPTKMRELAIA